MQSPHVHFAQAVHIAGASADDAAQLGLVVIAHRQLLKLPKKPLAETELHAFARRGHDENGEPLKDDGAGNADGPHGDQKQHMATAPFSVRLREKGVLLIANAVVDQPLHELGGEHVEHGHAQARGKRRGCSGL